MANEDRVVGVVVWRNRLTSENVPVIINGLKNARTRMGGNFSKTLPNGQTVEMSDQEALGAVLEEFYNLVQVQIGEAIAVSELKSFISESQDKLR